MGAKDSKSAKCKRSFGKEEIEGEAFTAGGFGTTIMIEAYTIKTAKGPRLLMLQDSPGFRETQSDEAKTFLKTICESFSVAK